MQIFVVHPPAPPPPLSLPHTERILWLEETEMDFYETVPLRTAIHSEQIPTLAPVRIHPILSDCVAD